MSEKGKNKSSRTSSSKFKLKISKSSKAEDSANLEERTPNHQSTPIRKVNVKNVEDSPEIDYNCSPIMGQPCTQQNEVIWSWHSPKGGTNSNNEIKTPKRSSQLQKRRIADSPLMFVPSKIKLAKQESNIDTFIANFKPFTNKMVEQEKEVPVPSSNENCQSIMQDQSDSERNLENSDEVDMKLVYPVDETILEITTERQNYTNLDDLFNDEIDESMVRCSQLVEEKFLVQTEQQQQKGKNDYSNLSKSEEKQESHSYNLSSKMTRLQNLSDVSFEKTKQAVGEITKPNLLKEIPVVIPDDSFDEFLSQVAEDEYNLVLRNSESPTTKPTNKDVRGNKLPPKKSLFCNSSGTSMKEGLARSSSFRETNKSIAENVNVEQNFAKSKSFNLQNQNCPFLSAKKLMQKTDNQPQSVTTPRKFFKSKSLSEPFSKDPKPCNYYKNKAPDASMCSSNKQNESRVIGKSFKCKIYSDSSINRNPGNSSNNSSGSSQDSFISHGNNFDNFPLSNLNRSMERLHSHRQTDSQEILCTAEEIERKRIEAKMKLEAKRRMMLNSRVTNTTRNLPIAQSIRR